MSLPSLNNLRTSKQLYRDLYRLIDHIAGDTTKGINLKNNLRMQFKLNMKLTDPEIIKIKKENGLRFITNYLVIESNKIMKNIKKEEINNIDGSKSNEEIEKEKILKRKEFKNKVLEEVENENDDK